MGGGDGSKSWVKDCLQRSKILLAVDFRIEYDNVQPRILSLTNTISTNNKLTINFNEKVHYVTLTIGGISKTYYNVEDYKTRFDNSFVVDLSDFDFSTLIKF